MNIERIETWWETIALERPYRIAGQQTDSVELGFVRVEAEDGAVGFGCAAPVEALTGESLAACKAAHERMPGQSGNFYRVSQSLHAEFQSTPAARAALDMALSDAFARRNGETFLDFLPRPARESLATSVTIGILTVDETLAEADEHVARGFTILKVKIGENFEQDLERLTKLREHIPPRITLRVDANSGYGPSDVERFFERMDPLGIELLEQPCKRDQDDELRRLPQEIRRRLAADESLLGMEDAQRLSSEPRPFGIWNVKLMKCGGPGPAVDLAQLAEQSGIDLMWGCMDESVVSIAAALHVAYGSKRTRYLDLDGGFDLARDPFRGGFEVRSGVMHTLSVPGLGVTRNA